MINRKKNAKKILVFFLIFGLIGGTMDHLRVTAAAGTEEEGSSGTEAGTEEDIYVRLKRKNRIAPLAEKICLPVKDRLQKYSRETTRMKAETQIQRTRQSFPQTRKRPR